MMSAVTFAVGPTVSFRSSSWISPSTEPSISRSSVPEISPFTCRLDPSHPVMSGAAACGVSRFFLSHIGPSQRQHTPRKFPRLDPPLQLTETPCEIQHCPESYSL